MAEDGIKTPSEDVCSQAGINVGWLSARSRWASTVNLKNPALSSWIQLFLYEETHIWS